MRNIPLLFLCVFCSCSKNSHKANDENSTAAPSYSVSYIHDLQITQFADTTIVIPVVLERNGPVAGISLMPSNILKWCRVYDLPITSQFNDTAHYSLAEFKMRFHPYQTGTYNLTFATTSTVADTQFHTISVVVLPADHCSAYLLGDYDCTSICAVTSSGFYGTVTVKHSTSPDTVYILGRQATVNCGEKTLKYSFNGHVRSGYGYGYFTDDSILIKQYSHQYEPDEIFDTCDIVMVRKW